MTRVEKLTERSKVAVRESDALLREVLTHLERAKATVRQAFTTSTDDPDTLIHDILRDVEGWQASGYNTREAACCITRQGSLAPAYALAWAFVAWRIEDSAEYGTIEHALRLLVLEALKGE